ncbi:MAG: hypothetical protein MUF68_08550 [Cyclobacteriaceae bacterium]|jgi:cytochrome c peroxidase|nr:hypothetical protein [Cyclobacteriaceae bacterium]
MKNNIFFFLFALILFGTEGCYYDRFNEQHPFDGYINTCDAELTDTYSGTVRYILQYNCLSCHNASSKKGGITLATLADVKNYVNSGQLMGSVRRESGFDAMPPGGSLRDCDIQQLQDWIDAGMPD